jgi:GT2 family glycosyltransferase
MKTTYPNFTVTIVDNGTTDDSLDCATARMHARGFKNFVVLNAGKNLGYAGGCNFGFEHTHGRTQGKYVVFLNNDTECEPDWLTRLVETAERDETLAALQPKLLSIQARNRGEKIFDYAGAAGGLVDKLGYPFARGRIFTTVEPDTGQYDAEEKIFWASGAAMFVRRSALEKVGVFDDDFFAHMEEIDLCWRLQMSGYSICAVPSSVVYHYGGATLAASSPTKAYLNHRNNLMMLMKNMEGSRLWWLLPLRVMLEFAALGFYAKSGKFSYAKEVLRGLGWNMRNLTKIFRKRRAVQVMRVRRDAALWKETGGERIVVIRAALAL